MIKPSSSVGAPSQHNMTDSGSLESGFDFLSLQEVASILKLSKISVYRMVAKRLLSVYRVGRRMRFRKEDLREYLESTKYEREKV